MLYVLCEFKRLTWSTIQLLFTYVLVEPKLTTMPHLHAVLSPLAKCHRVNIHAQFSRDGGSLAFLYNVGRCQKLDEQRWTYQFTVFVDGSGLWRVPVVAGTRHSYGRGGRLLVCDGTGYYEVLDRREVHRLELPNSGERPRALPTAARTELHPVPTPSCHTAAIVVHALSWVRSNDVGSTLLYAETLRSHLPSRLTGVAPWQQPDSSMVPHRDACPTGNPVPRSCVGWRR